MPSHEFHKDSTPTNNQIQYRANTFISCKFHTKIGSIKQWEYPKATTSPLASTLDSNPWIGSMSKPCRPVKDGNFAWYRILQFHGCQHEHGNQRIGYVSLKYTSNNHLWTDHAQLLYQWPRVQELTSSPLSHGKLACKDIHALSKKMLGAIYNLIRRKSPQTRYL